MIPWYLMAKGKGGGGYKTASGPIVSVSDALAAPLRSLLVNIEPVQDLHGYDNPWPAGGGKNLYPFDNVTNKFVNSGGVISTASNPDQYCGFEDKVPIVGGEDYVIAIFGASDSSTIYYGEWDADGVFLGRQFPITESGTNCKYAAIAASANAASIFAYAYDSNSPYSSLTGIKGYIQKGTTAPTSWTPYSNICPISGWSAVNVWRTGGNLWDEEWEVGNINSKTGATTPSDNAIRSKNFCACVGGLGYCIVKPSGYQIYAYWYDSSKNYLSRNGGTPGTTIIRTAPNDAVYFKLACGNSTNPLQTYGNDISMNYPATDTAYHASHVTNITIQLGQTVYGGTLDVTNGVLTVDRAMVDLGTLGWGLSATSRFYNTSLIQNFKRVTTSAERATGLVCSAYKPSSNLSFSDAQDDYSWLRGQDNSVFDIVIKDSRYTSVSDFKTAVSGVQLVYELATPITIPLTPTEISTLQGQQNNVWADIGDVTVEYRVAGGVDPDLMKLAVAFMGRR